MLLSTEQKLNKIDEQFKKLQEEYSSLVNDGDPIEKLETEENSAFLEARRVISELKKLQIEKINVLIEGERLKRI